jgi:hypothetical protein
MVRTYGTSSPAVSCADWMIGGGSNSADGQMGIVALGDEQQGPSVALHAVG